MNAIRSAIAIAIVVLVVGCGGAASGPARAPVSGKLTIGGKAVEGVEVHFVNPEYPQHGSFAVTDSDGGFKLVQGAVPGSNTVFFSKIEGEGMVTNPEEGMDAGQFEAMASAAKGKAAEPVAKQVIPSEYATSASKLTFVVPQSGADDAVFDL